MSPTGVEATADNRGCVLSYRLDHAISSKGMGIALPTPPQPGAATRAVLAEVERGWLLVFAMLILGLTLAGVNHAVLLSVLFGAAAACVHGLVADFSDLLLGFWGAAALVLVPMLFFLAWLLTRVVPREGKLLAIQLLGFGLLYPAVAGLDHERQTLYFNLCAMAFLALAAWQLAGRFRGEEGATTGAAPRSTASLVCG